MKKITKFYIYILQFCFFSSELLVKKILIKSRNYPVYFFLFHGENRLL